MEGTQFHSQRLTVLPLIFFIFLSLFLADEFSSCSWINSLIQETKTKWTLEWYSQLQEIPWRHCQRTRIKSSWLPLLGFYWLHRNPRTGEWLFPSFTTSPSILHNWWNIQGGSNMLIKQGGFKKLIKKSFPEADFSQWSKFFPTSNPLALHSWKIGRASCRERV